MKNDLKVTFIQTKLIWEDKTKNFAHFEALLSKIETATDIVILPEMFTTGFTMQSEKFAEVTGGPSMQWMWRQAQKLKAAICGSIILKEGTKFYNRFIWMNQDGSHEFYNKRHLFRMGSEHEHYSPGISKLIISYKGWKICPLICYDLRFPVWSRNKFFNDGYDVLLYVANWPERRNYAWNTLLLARAIENQSYVIGVNRVGTDGNTINHSGNSIAIDFLGTPIRICGANKEEIISVILKKDALEECRASFPAGMDMDEFMITN